MPSPIYPAQPLPLRVFTVSIPGVAVATSGSPADRGNVALPSSITRWTPLNATIRAASATGTMAAASIGLFTQAAGAGTPVVVSALVTALTAANKLAALTIAAQTDGITDTNIYVRQTVNSVNAGTVDVVVTGIDLT